jgi:catechol 2,3-dioxygenase-like lactoylglutathione lyase family enzyme
MAFEGLGTIGQIHVSVTDVERSVSFYRDVLGMRFLFEVPGQSMAFFDCGGVRLYLGQPESPEFRSNPILYFTVPDLFEAHAALRERGVDFRDEPHLVAKMGETDLWMAFFTDPDGNHFALMQDRPAAPSSEPS